MKIAVTYCEGEVFAHFGHCENFKIYVVEDNQVVSAEVVPANGQGHDALSSFLKDLGVDVVICGGIGEGAKNALSSANIEVVSGAAGDADIAVVSYLSGTLNSEGVNCNKDENSEGCGCGCGSEGGCGGGCGGCGGGCGGGPRYLFEGANVGKACVVNYHGTLDDGTCFDSSFERGEPIQFICGVGMMIPGFDRAVADMKVGDTVDVHLEPAEAYGEYDPSGVLDFEIAQLPGAENLNAGEKVLMSNAFGQQFPVVVLEKTEDRIKLDTNHEFAGKALNFKIELVDVIEE